MEIHYNLYGNSDQPLLVFLHGGGVSGWMWDEQVRYFQHYRRLVFDLPGHGESTGGDDFSIQETASLIAEMIKKHKGDQPVLVIGFSLGAQILISILSDYNHLIDKAMIISAAVRPMTFPKLTAKFATWMLPLAKIKSFSRMQAKFMYLNAQHFTKYFEETSAITKETFFNVMFENVTFSVPNGFAKANSHILVLKGAKENSLIKKSFTDILQSNDMCVGAVIPGVGHGIPLFDTNYFNKLIENWIETEKLPDNAIKITSNNS